MQTLNVTCPKCQKQFGIKNHSVKTELKVNCPYCQYLLTVVVKRNPIRLDLNAPDTGPSPLVQQMYQASQPQPQRQQATPPPVQPMVSRQSAQPMASPQPGGGRTILPDDYLRRGGAIPGGHTILPEDIMQQHRAAAAQSGLTGETEPYSGSPVMGGRTAAQGRPVLVFGGACYPLVEGRNTVGRRGQTSQASIQLPTTDMCMSRVNAMLDVVKLADGSFHVSVSSVNEHNLVKINGHAVPVNNRIMLLDGMVLMLGQSIVKFTYR